jgi:hypothetical protein
VAAAGHLYVPVCGPLEPGPVLQYWIAAVSHAGRASVRPERDLGSPLTQRAPQADMGA